MKNPIQFLEAKMKGRKDFTFGFLTYTLMKWLGCCLQRCCKKQSWFQRQLQNFEQFKIATERLRKETDLQNMIQLDRVSQLFHKAKDFGGKQRRIASFASKYIVSGRYAEGQTVDGSQTDLQGLKSKLTNRQNYPNLSTQEQG